MDEIKVGDVFKHNDFNIFVVVAGRRRTAWRKIIKTEMAKNS